MRQVGWQATKELYRENTFYAALNNLLECGISKSHLQNLHKNPNGKVIPFVRMFELNMCDQLPSDYQMPVSQYSSKKGLYLVA